MCTAHARGGIGEGLDPHVGVGGGLVPPGQEFNVWGGTAPPDRHLIACGYRQLVPPPKKVAHAHVWLDPQNPKYPTQIGA